jgi:hypothetical protein
MKTVMKAVKSMRSRALGNLIRRPISAPIHKRFLLSSFYASEGVTGSWPVLCVFPEEEISDDSSHYPPHGNRASEAELEVTHGRPEGPRVMRSGAV